MITAYGDVAMAVKAMKAGAFDFLQKPANPKELLDCIERALNYSPEHPEHSSIRQTATAKVESLTARQRQILQLVLAGHPSKNIASDLRISQHTVDEHSRRDYAENQSDILVRTDQNCPRCPAGSTSPQLPAATASANCQIYPKQACSWHSSERLAACDGPCRTLPVRNRLGWANSGFGQSGKDGWAGRKQGALPSQVFYISCRLMKKRSPASDAGSRF